MDEQSSAQGLCCVLNERSYLCVLSRFSRVRFFATPWTVACQAPLSTGFSRQKHWNRLPLPPPFPHPRGRTCISCTGRQILHCFPPGEAQMCVSMYN